MGESTLNNASFVRSYVKPLLWIFLIPLIGFFFFNHAESTYDGRILENVLASIDKSTSLSAEQRDALTALFRKTPVSKMLVSDDPRYQGFVDQLSDEAKSDYGQFRWGVRLSAASMAASGVATILALIALFFSLRSQAAQWYSLSISWHLLKLVCVFQVLVQGVLIVGLSFWITALWFEIYIMKLIFIVGILAGMAAWLILKAMFTKLPDGFSVQAELLDLARAPELKEKIHSICRKFQTVPPDQVLVGVDDNFFVTEHPVTVSGKTYTGRTLYLSISLLRKLGLDEAEAVLAHEMAHFSGNDTLYSKKIAPLMGKYAQYLEALHSSPVSLPVFLFMFLFWNLHQISLARLSRSREFRADRLAAETTSARAVAGSLAKVQAYGQYRGKIEGDLFSEKTLHNQLKIAERVNMGFSAFVESVDLNRDIYAAEVPHPFDSHPPFEERLKNVGADLTQIDKALLTKPVEASWHDRIENASELESRIWQVYEDRFKRVHEESLAWRLVPVEPWEIELVKKYFPERTIEGKKGNDLILDYEKVQYKEWGSPVFFSDMYQPSLNEDLLTIPLKSEGAVQLHLNKFKISTAEVLAAFERYYGRHMASQEFRKMESAAAQADEVKPAV